MIGVLTNSMTIMSAGKACVNATMKYKAHRVIDAREEAQVFYDAHKLCGNGVDPERCHHKAACCHSSRPHWKLKTAPPLL